MHEKQLRDSKRIMAQVVCILAIVLLLARVTPRLNHRIRGNRNLYGSIADGLVAGGKMEICLSLWGLCERRQRLATLNK
jgi:hypothetical protein